MKTNLLFIVFAAFFFQGVYAEKLPTYLQDADSVITRDVNGVNSQKTVKTYSSATLETTISTYSWQNNGWLLTNTEVYRVNQNGDLVLNESKYYKFEYTYDSQNRLTDKKQYEWDYFYKSWVPNNITHHGYYNNTDTTISYNNWSSGNGTMQPYLKIITEPAGGKPVVEKQYKWDSTSSAWKSYRQEHTQYNADGKETYLIVYDWDETANTLTNYYKINTEYTANESLLKDYKWENNEWIPIEKTFKKYNAKGEVIFREDYLWDADKNDYVPRRKQTYSFNGSQLTTETSQRYNATIGAYENNYLTDYLYDSAGRQISESNYNWDKNENAYTGSNRADTIFNANGKKDNITSFKWNSTTKAWNVDKYYINYYNGVGGDMFAFYYQGRRYEISKLMKNWEQAAGDAAAKNMHLVYVEDQAEQTTLQNQITASGINTWYTSSSDGGSAAYMWIGATDKTLEGNWVWDGTNVGGGILFWTGQGAAGSNNGMPVGFVNWGGKAAGTIQEPDNYNGNPSQAQNAAAIGLTEWPRNSGGLGAAGEWNDIDVTNNMMYIMESDVITNTDKVSQSNLRVYPNPAASYFTISGITETTHITVFDISGKMVTAKNVSPDEKISIVTLAKGIYLVKINDKTAKLVVK